jgi:hypothetical protein
MTPRKALARAVITAAAVTLLAVGSLRAQQVTPPAVHVAVTIAGERKVIDFERFALWAPDGAVVLHDGTREIRQQPPAARYYRGRSLHDGDFAFFTVDDGTGAVDGLMVFGGKRYFLAADVSQQDRRRGTPAVPPLVAQEAEADDMAAITQWRCSVDGERPARTPISKTMAAVDAEPAKRESIGNSQSYVVSLEIETDYDLYLSSGSSPTILTAHIDALTGALSTILFRDLNVTLQIHAIQTHLTPQQDPWHAQPSAGVGAALYELADYYHANKSSVPRSAVVPQRQTVQRWNRVGRGAMPLAPRLSLFVR